MKFHGWRLPLVALVCLGMSIWPDPIWARQSHPRAVRPAHWAASLTREGLPNFYKVSDALYRGAQPTREGIRELKKMGIKTIVNLRSRHSDSPLLEDSSIRYISIPMKASRLRQEDLVRFLRIVSDSSHLPVFVHCLHGADRTGVSVAVYRVAVQGWEKREAVREMVEGGYGFHWIYRRLKSVVQSFSPPAWLTPPRNHGN